MLTTKYHIGSMIAIFFALGTGILIGGTLGQKWMHQTEAGIVEMLVDKYEKQVSQNQQLQKQIGSLQLMNQSVSPIFNHERIVWIRPRSAENEMLALVMKSTGAEWIEQNTDMLDEPARTVFEQIEQTIPDIIMISDPEVSAKVSDYFYQREASGTGFAPKVVDISSKQLQLTEPQDIVNFIIYLKNILQEESHAAISLYRYPGME